MGINAQKLRDAFIRSGKTLALAESCTGGAVAASLVAFPGASQFLQGSIVAYSSEWKENFLGVSSLATHNAVSKKIVEEMVLGLFMRTSCDYAAAVSGFAGPEGGTVDAPVGTIYIAICKRGDPVEITEIHAPKGRSQAIEFAVQTTISLLLRLSL